MTAAPILCGNVSKKPRVWQLASSGDIRDDKDLIQGWCHPVIFNLWSHLWQSLERLVQADKELCKILSSEAQAFTQNWNSEKNLERSIISDNFHGIRGCLCEKVSWWFSLSFKFSIKDLLPIPIEGKRIKMSILISAPNVLFRRQSI